MYTAPASALTFVHHHDWAGDSSFYGPPKSPRRIDGPHFEHVGRPHFDTYSSKSPRRDRGMMPVDGPVDYHDYVHQSGIHTPRAVTPRAYTPRQTGFQPIDGPRPTTPAHQEAMRQAGARQLTPAQRALLDDVKMLYSPQPPISLIRSTFAPDGRFIDPLSEVKGHRDIENQFLLLERFFSAVELRESAAYAIELKNPHATAIVCENDQFYWRHGQRDPFIRRVVTTLELDPNGHVRCHRDQWLDKGEDPVKAALNCRSKSVMYDFFARKPMTMVGSWYGERYRKEYDSRTGGSPLPGQQRMQAAAQQAMAPMAQQGLMPEQRQRRGLFGNVFSSHVGRRSHNSQQNGMGYVDAAPGYGYGGAGFGPAYGPVSPRGYGPTTPRAYY